MKSGLITIIKKELLRFFTDRRMVFLTILLPGLMIYLLYSVMGQALEKQFDEESYINSSVVAVNIPESLKDVVEELMVVKDENNSDIGQLKALVESKQNDALIIFPDNFENDMLALLSGEEKETPNVEIYYNSSSDKSEITYNLLIEVLNSFEDGMSNVFDINKDIEDIDLAKKEDVSASFLAGLMPMLIIMFIFSSCLSITTESIAGEKDRGTLATVLVTKIKRSHIAIGKIVSMGLIAVLGGVSCIVGLVLAMPNLAKIMGIEFSANLYSAMDYILIALVVITTAMFIVGLISIISAVAKTAKEAQAYSTPLIIIVMLVGFSSMFKLVEVNGAAYSAIPIFGSVTGLSDILSFSGNYNSVIIAIISNLVFTVIETIILSKLFNSEKIVFSK